MEAPIKEANTVPLEKVKFQRKWTFWENYEKKDKTGNEDFDKLMEKIFSFDNLIAFWQFWNKYPGRIPGDIYFNGDRML
ncbi:MAG: hypothetical protein MJ252_13865 [archaeon]|nr:hypothetical protein [archaeon]